MSAVPVWNCEFKPAPGSYKQDLKSLTVGDKFLLSCHGDLAVEWDDSALKVAFPDDKDAYTLFILKPESLRPNSAELIVTGYKAGQHEPAYLRILQGEKGFEFLKPQWQIQSVLKPGLPTEPFPPFGPWGLAVPFWILIATAIVTSLALVLLWRRIRRFNQRRTMLKDLERHRTAMPPLHQFYRDSRQLRRKLHAVKAAEELRPLAEELEREVRLYLLRRCQIPALDWSNREILRDLRRRHRPTYEAHGDKLKRVLLELSRLRAQESLLFKDLEQMQNMSLDIVEKLDQALEAKS